MSPGSWQPFSLSQTNGADGGATAGLLQSLSDGGASGGGGGG